MRNLRIQLTDGTGDEPQERTPLVADRAVAFLQAAEITAEALIPWGSNYSFAVGLQDHDGAEQLAIYKPRAGERPLHDFPDGTLFRREVAAFVLNRRLGWNIVPPTVVRTGPHGIGSLQLYIDPLPETDTADPRPFWTQPLEAIERIVLFDHLANNADRKWEHLLLDRQGNCWGIDHGLTFNQVPKLRTVLWQFVEKPISPALLLDLGRLAAEIEDASTELAPYLNRPEIDAFVARVQRLLQAGHYPALDPWENIPFGFW